MAEKVNFIKVENAFKVCPNCGYDNGFHSVFERIGDSDEFSWKLTCPSCRKVYDIGLKVHIGN